MTVNALRAFLAEFGLIAVNRIDRLGDLLAAARADTLLPTAAQARIEFDAAILPALG